MDQLEIDENLKLIDTVSERQAEAEALFMSLGDGAITTDEFGRITRVNAAALQILGFSKDDLIGSWFPKAIVAVDASDSQVSLIDRPIIKTFLTGRPVTEKTFYRQKNSQKIPVAVNVSPIMLEGKPLGAIEVFRDITLEEEVDRMKSDFISLASHQLRTPLSAIKTYSHMLSEGYLGELNSEQKKSLETIINASNRMNELISTLLNITRMEGGMIAVNLKYLKIDKLVTEVLPELELMAKPKNISITLVQKAASASTKLLTDGLIVREVIINLVSNAIKYTPNDGKIEIIVTPKAKEILVKVKDSGWGIPTYSQDQVFSKFFRAQNIVKKETNGTGLGLYLVRGLLEALNGQIWFKSAEGKGTSFYFTLPRRQKVADKTDGSEKLDKQVK